MKQQKKNKKSIRQIMLITSIIILICLIGFSFPYLQCRMKNIVFSACDKEYSFSWDTVDGCECREITIIDGCGWKEK